MVTVLNLTTGNKYEVVRFDGNVITLRGIGRDKGQSLTEDVEFDLPLWMYENNYMEV